MGTTVANTLKRERERGGGEGAWLLDLTHVSAILNRTF